MWSPLYSHAKYVRPICANLELLIKANEAEALNWSNDGQDMPPFKVYRKAIWYNTLWPVISIVPQTTTKQGSGDEVLPQTHLIVVEIEDAGPDPDALTETVERRIQAVDMIVTSANRNLLKSGMDADHIAIENLWVTSHNYTQFMRGAGQQSIYLQVGSMDINIQTIEG